VLTAVLLKHLDVFSIVLVGIIHLLLLHGGLKVLLLERLLIGLSLAYFEVLTVGGLLLNMLIFLRVVEVAGVDAVLITNI